jgi:hypothetical protein
MYNSVLDMPYWSIVAAMSSSFWQQHSHTVHRSVNMASCQLSCVKYNRRHLVDRCRVYVSDAIVQGSGNRYLNIFAGASERA